MSFFLHDDVLDNGLNEIKSAATRVVLCDGAPASYAEATTAPAGGKALADRDVDSSDWTLAAGAPDGRKITCAAQSGVVVDASGDADHLAVVDDDTSRLLAVDELDSVYSMTAAETVTIGAFALRLAAPVAA